MDFLKNITHLQHNKLLIILLVLLGISLLSNGTIANQKQLKFCQRYPLLKGGINIKDFNRCQKLFKTLSQQKQCKLNGPVPSKKCREKVLSHKYCQQTSLLLKTMPWATLATIAANQHGNLTIVRSTTVADGVDVYSIINPQGCLIHTNIDPRKLSNELRTKYRGKSFIILSKQYKYLHYSNKKQAVIITLQVNSPCLACKTVGCAKVKYNFSADGKLMTVHLVDFSSCAGKH